jgi:hypothetical protein
MAQCQSMRPLYIAGTGMNAEPDFERVASVLIRVVLRVLVHDGNDREGEPSVDPGLLSSVY